ncbi:MAG: DNA primase [Pseudomonadota bacterium]
MAGRIPRQFIDDVLARTDIVDVIDSYVKLTKGGRDFKACCPFHQEKSPSFTVSQEKQFYHCFGCGAHGSAVGFLMEYAGLDFPEAVENLAERLGLEVPREGGAPRADYAAVHEVLDAANRWFRNQLRQHQRKSMAVDYLKGRGLSGQIAGTYELGFAPPARDALLQELAGQDIERRNLLVTAGLAVERTPGQYADKFRGRVMFPIHSRRGQVIGFGGRVLDDGQPKYLNSPETPVFHKGRELYGLWQARRANRKLQRLVVVEGYMDVVALSQFGITWAVASLGTAATGEHVERLFQATSHILFCFDGDRAGRQAAWRALENSLPYLRDGREVGFMFLPDGEDPDTLVRNRGPEAFTAAADAATPLSDYLFGELAAGLELDRIEGRSQLAERARPLLNKLPPGVFGELAWQRLAEQTRLPADRLGAGEAGGSNKPTPARPAHEPASSRSPSLMRTVITMLVHYPHLGGNISGREALRALTVPGAELLNELLDLLAERPDLTTGGVLELFRDHPHGPHIAKLAAGTPPLLDTGLDAELGDALKKLLNLKAEERIRALTEKARDATLTPAEAQEFKTLLAGHKN